MKEKICVTRQYRFCAAHRLHTDALSDDVNRKVYDKCNNPNGHGHDYTVFVTVAGELDPQTGEVTDVPALDRLVNRKNRGTFRSPSPERRPGVSGNS